MEDFKATLNSKLADINILLEKYRVARYPGKKVLQEGKSLIEDVLEGGSFFGPNNS